MNNIAGTRRVHRASDKDDIIKALTSEQLGVFREIWRLMMFAAQVGYRNQRREALNAIDSGKGIDQTTFGNSGAWPGVLYLMVLAETEATDTLGGTAEAEERRLNLFQEYANGGLSILAEFFAKRTVDLDGLMAFVDSQQGSQAGPPDLAITI